MKYNPLKMPKRTILGPGPSSANQKVLNAMSLPVVGYLDPAFFELLDQIIPMLSKVFKTEQNVAIVSGAGAAGMEAGFTNLAERGDKVIICSYGHFCERQIMMAERLGLEVIPLRSEWGKSMNPQLLYDTLKNNSGVKLVSSIHAETSTGVLQPLDEIVEMTHKFDALFMTDVVTSLSGSELNFDSWDIDYAYGGSQKCLAAPPGISPVSISDNALDYIRNRKTLPSSWYFDLSLIIDYWYDKKPHHTAPVNMIYALREALSLVMDEGLENRWDRHKKVSEGLRAGLIALGLELPISEKDRLDQLTVISIPENINDVELRNRLLEEYSIEVGRGLGEFQGKVIRIGLMGESCNPSNVFTLLNAFEKILPQLGWEISEGESLNAANNKFNESNINYNY